MTNINYEAIARENGSHPDKLYAPIAKANGFDVDWSPWYGKYVWIGPLDYYSDSYHNTSEEAWKAACVENGLVKE